MSEKAVVREMWSLAKCIVLTPLWRGWDWERGLGIRVCWASRARMGFEAKKLTLTITAVFRRIWKSICERGLLVWMGGRKSKARFDIRRR